MNGSLERRQIKQRKETSLRVNLLKSLIYRKEQEKFVQMILDEDDVDDLIEITLNNENTSTHKTTTTKRPHDLILDDEHPAKRFKSQ